MTSTVLLDDPRLCNAHAVRPHKRAEHPPQAAPFPQKQHIILDQGLSCFIGRGQITDDAQLRSAIWLTFFHGETVATVAAGGRPNTAEIAVNELMIVVSPRACERFFRFALPKGRWFLSSDLRAITAAIAERRSTDRPDALYLRAKGIELACETVTALRSSALVPCCGASDLSETDTRRLVAARNLIEARLQEALSIGLIAGACGLNRSSLTRGFRRLNGVTVATFINNVRMLRAKALLTTTDLGIATVGYRCGYQSNASFARSFARHFGIPPSAMRASVKTDT